MIDIQQTTHAYPRRVAPIGPERLLSDLALVLESTGLAHDGGPEATIWWFEPLEREHARDPRRYAQVIPEMRRFEFARAILWLPDEHRLGLLLHEAGHLLDRKGGEPEADAAAFRATGTPLAYDLRWPGHGLQTILANYMGAPIVVDARVRERSGALEVSVHLEEQGRLIGLLDARQGPPAKALGPLSSGATRKIDRALRVARIELAPGLDRMWGQILLATAADAVGSVDPAAAVVFQGNDLLGPRLRDMVHVELDVEGHAVATKRPLHLPLPYRFRRNYVTP